MSFGKGLLSGGSVFPAVADEQGNWEVEASPKRGAHLHAAL